MSVCDSYFSKFRTTYIVPRIFIFRLTLLKKTIINVCLILFIRMYYNDLKFSHEDVISPTYRKKNYIEQLLVIKK